MTKKENLRDLIFLTFCCIMGLTSKMFISPLANLATDLIRMPGGGVSGGLCMSFLVLGASMSRYSWAGGYIGFMQGLLALVFGISGYQGIFALITFTIPGIITDVFRYLWRKSVKSSAFYLLTTCIANASTAVLSNVLVFHFSGLTFMLWIALAASSGILGGFISSVCYKCLPLFLIREDAG